MAGNTIFVSIDTVVLTDPATENPTTFDGVVEAGGAGVQAYGPTDWTLINEGYVIGTGNYGTAIEAGIARITNTKKIEGSDRGISLGDGLITNAAGAQIIGGDLGVGVGNGTIENSGTISSSNGTGVSLVEGVLTNAASGLVSAGADGVISTGNPIQRYAITVNNAGSIVSAGNVGVYLYYGGSVTNTGRISGYFDGVEVQGAAGVVDNVSGEIAATWNYGIYLKDGGTVINHASIAGRFAGVQVNGATGTVQNYGAIADGVVLKDGGVVYNVNYASISGGVQIGGAAGAVSNSSVITGTESIGVVLSDGGDVFNSGKISSNYFGVLISGGAGTVSNYRGSITGTEYGVAIRTASGSVVNYGSIVGTENIGVYLKDDGTVTNDGSIIGGRSGILLVGASGRVTNDGSVAGTNGTGVSLLGNAGTVTNAPSASISGGDWGVMVAGTDAQVFNLDGTITGTSVAGVLLSGGGYVENGEAFLGSISGYGIGVEIYGAAGTVANSATIIATVGDGVYLGDGGTVSNVSSISGGFDGIHVRGAAGIVDNYHPSYAPVGYDYGSIIGVNNIGAYLEDGGTVTNAASSSISGGMSGVVIDGAVGTVDNSGSIVGTQSIGVYLEHGGAVTNTASGLIKGAVGVALDGGGTVMNAGTITGTAGTAVSFGGSGSNLLVDDPGSVFNGIVAGNAGAGNTLELASGGAGALSGLGTSFTNFATVKVDSGATWTLGGVNTLVSGSTLTNSGTLTLSGSLSDAGSIVNNGKLVLDGGTATTASLTGTGTVGLETSSKLDVQNTVGAGQDVVFDDKNETLAVGAANEFAGTITGFIAGDVIDLTGVSASGAQANMNYATDVLTVSEGGNAYTFQFDKVDDFTGDFFRVTPDNSGAGPGLDITESTTPCYCGGTLIRTPRGEEPVETLRIGDAVTTKSGAARPIKWIGRRSYAGRFALGRKEILPVCITAGALDDNVPARDLWISPHHAMYLDGVLIEAKDLINGVSIMQVERVESVAYFHIELDTHDVIIAEGALSETFADDDSRGMFHNAHDYVAGPNDEPAQYCAPRLSDGYQVDAACRRIARRAGLHAAEDARLGVLHGLVEEIRPERIAGWAHNADSEGPVCLDILAGGTIIGQVLANGYRQDLADAGIHDGRHGFAFTPPSDVTIARSVVEVRRSRDGAALDKCERILRRAS